MPILHDADAGWTPLHDRTIAVIGYGNQGRSQALNLRDSSREGRIAGLLVGNIADAYADRARADGFTVLPIAEAASKADVVMLLIPDEIMPAVFAAEIAPRLKPGAAVCMASGYTVAFGQFAPPPGIDLVLLAPRMIGAGVRDLYLTGEGFPAFFGVEQDATGHARELVLALAKGIGATRIGVVEVTFAQEAELDLFTEQGFGPAFGAVLMSSINLLIDAGYPPAAVLLELYMSGEFAYTLGKIAQMGTVEQAALHSTTSQYGSMSRGIRFQLPELRAKLRESLEDIRSGVFAREWEAEQAEGAPILEVLKEQARAMPLYELEQTLLRDLGRPGPRTSRPQVAGTSLRARLARALQALTLPQPLPLPSEREKEGSQSQGQSQRQTQGRTSTAPLPSEKEEEGRQRPGQQQLFPEVLSLDRLDAVLTRFLALAAEDPALRAFAAKRDLDTHYVLGESDVHADSFHLGFHQGAVTGGLGAPPAPAQVRLTLSPATLDGMFTNTLNPARAAMAGEIAFDGEARVALSIQRVQKDLTRLYSQARREVMGE